MSSLYVYFKIENNYCSKVILSKSCSPSLVKLSVGRFNVGTPEIAVNDAIYALIYGKTIAGAFFVNRPFFNSSKLISLS